MISLYLHEYAAPLDHFDHLLQQIPERLQARIQRRKQRKKQEASLRAYLILQKALRENFEVELDQMSFMPSGKPVFLNHEIYFNISHAANRVGVVISNRGTLGLDIEAFRKFDKVESAFLFFSPVEQASILNDQNPDQKLIEFWSKKEALVKAVGGQMFDMASKTDVRFSTTIWKEQIFNFYPIEQDFDGFVWVAASFSTNHIVIQPILKIEDLIDSF